MQKRRRLLAAPAALLAAGLFLAACGSKDSSSSSASDTSGSSAKGGKVALLLPETKTARYESQDKPLFEAKLKSLCSDCELLYSNANQVAATQLSQAESAITNGAKVIVLDPVDADAAGAIVTKANAANIPVISYDRLISNADIKYYISFDNEQVGKLQGTSLLSKLSGKTGQIVMINGSATDPNAASFKKGAHSVLDGKVTIGKEYDTPEWSPDNAQNEMQQAITALGKDKIIGVYAANDGTASGAIAALKGAQVSPLPPVTGQDAELAGIQRIVAGDQYMTIYKAIKPEAEQAAELAASLAQGKTPSLQTTKVNNGKKDVDSVILTPVAVTKDNIKSTVVADNFWTVAQICTDQYKSACTAAGLS